MRRKQSDRVNILAWGLGVLLALMLSETASWCWGKHLRKPAPIEVGTQKQFFVDDYIIDSMHNAFKILNQPVKYPDNPILELEPRQAIGGDELVIVTGSVIYDEEESLFKMWYEGANYGWTRNVVAYATSRDGMHWELPKLGFVEHRGSKDNNIIFVKGSSPAVFKDRVAKEPQRKYKMLYQRRGIRDGIGVAFSLDGIHWTPGPDKPVIAISDSSNSVMAAGSTPSRLKNSNSGNLN